jgi:hypothetical protein
VTDQQPYGHGKLNAADLERMIRDAAYFRALERGFTEGDPKQDWLLAEREVMQRLAELKPAVRTPPSPKAAATTDRVDAERPAADAHSARSRPEGMLQGLVERVISRLRGK